MKIKNQTSRFQLKIQPEQMPVNTVSYLVLYQRKSGRMRFKSREKQLKDFLNTYTIPSYFLALDELASSEALDIEALQKQHGFSRVIVAGGDGTIRRVAEYIYFHQLDLPIAIIPSGSANTLGRALGIDSFAKAKQTIVSGEVTNVQAGTLNGEHLFLIAASFGQISVPTIRAHDYYKHHIGFLAYVLASIPMLFRFRRTKVRFMETDEEQKVHSILAMPFNKMKALRALHRQESKLNIIIYKGNSFLGFLASILLLFVSHHETENIIVKNTDRFAFEGDFKDSTHLDGDIIRPQGNRYILEITERPLMFLVPN